MYNKIQIWSKSVILIEFCFALLMRNFTTLFSLIGRDSTPPKTYWRVLSTLYLDYTYIKSVSVYRLLATCNKNNTTAKKFCLEINVASRGWFQS